MVLDIEKEILIALEYGYQRAMLYRLLYSLAPEEAVNTDELLKGNSSDTGANFVYSAEDLQNNPAKLASLICGVVRRAEHGTFADAGSDISGRLLEKLPAELGQSVIADTIRYREDRNRILDAGEDEEQDELIGRNPKWLNILKYGRKAALCEAPILITGETGTGKERLAQYIHRHSPRRGGGFIPISCGAIPESLAHSELFGYEEGAFTGAVRGGRRGKLEAANGGTVLLDDVDALPKIAQVALLRFIETGEIQKVGGIKTNQADVRIICTGNRSLEELAKEGEFRYDLYYRLAILKFHIPALRERKDDIPLFARHFLKNIKFDHSAATIRLITDEAVRKLGEYDWRGNLRELYAVIMRAVMMSENGLISENDIIFDSTYEGNSSGTGAEITLFPQLWEALKNIKLSSRERSGIVRFLQEHFSGSFSNGNWVEEFAVSPATARKRLAALVEAGILRREGDKRGTRYLVSAEIEGMIENNGR